MKRRNANKFFHVLPEDQKVAFEPGSTILESLIENDIEINSVCGGMGSCGTCHVFIEKGLELLPPLNELEKERAQDLIFAENERLACQLEACEGIVVRIPK